MGPVWRLVMKIVIVGDGKVGGTLAEQLSLEGHDITIIDNMVTNAILFNKDMIKNYGLDNPYTLVEDNEWTLEKFGSMVKAVGEDGDSFFEDVRQTDDEVIFILAGGETIRLPKAKEVNFVIERTTLMLKYGQTEKLAVTQKGVESYSISKPDGWRASLDGDVLSITAPVEGNIYAEKSGKVTVVAVGATATVVAAVEVNLPVFDDNNAGSSDWEEWN